MSPATCGHNSQLTTHKSRTFQHLTQIVYKAREPIAHFRFLFQRTGPETSQDNNGMGVLSNVRIFMSFATSSLELLFIFLRSADWEKLLINRMWSGGREEYSWGLLDYVTYRSVVARTWWPKSVVWTSDVRLQLSTFHLSIMLCSFNRPGWWGFQFRGAEGRVRTLNLTNLRAVSVISCLCGNYEFRFIVYKSKTCWVRM